MYKSVEQKVSFPALEEEILAFWEKNKVFEKSISRREGAQEYVFYDGPPFATGLPHFGHFIPSTIKDIIPRYQTMKGKKVERRFGWDCHGLPIENLIEKELNLNSKQDIEKFGIAEFNEACRASVLRYVNEWRQTITRLGRWVDFDNDYKTMDTDYMETIWWVVKSLWEKGLLYEGHYVLPNCPRCATVLSNHELNLGGYKDVHDPSITVRFKIVEGKDIPKECYFLAWTTTPWTLPSNLGLALGPEIDYVLVEDLDSSDNYILAEARLPAYYKSEKEYRIVWKKKGADLLGIEYEPILPYFKNARESGAFRTFPGDFVSTENGTGIVHIAPGFGEDDARVLKGTGVPTICPIDIECKFTDEVPDFKGLFVKDADKGIMEKLKAEGKLIKRDQILHAYPHCWRCDSPLIYRAISSWFVSVEKIKQDMLDANSKIFWVPGHIKSGRFGKWLEGARDWAISRNRYWGNPLPIWKCSDCDKALCIGSRAELKEYSGVSPDDLHMHFVDKITFKCPDCTGTMKRIPEVLDCWFESGAMTYAQNHYPFENKEFFESHFPADFISEGLDQTRGWFYTLIVLSAALFKKPAFKNCIVTGIVLASDGRKMSKSLKNYTDPADVISSYGADAVRLFLVHSALMKADDLRFSDDGVKEVLKSIIIPLWNAYSFFVMYANIDKITPNEAPKKPGNPLDKWILSLAESLVEKCTTALDNYDLSKAVDPIVEFIDLLNNWYIRRSRRRFWKAGNDTDKLEAYGTLYNVLKTLITVASPFMPFITEVIWQNLRRDDECESVHLADFPVPIPERRDPGLEFKMASVQKAVSMGRALRSQYGIKNRQPLKTVEIVTGNPEERKALLEMEEIIQEELNVKNVVFKDNEEDLVEYEAKANFRILGKELGKDMKEAAEKIAAFSQAQVKSILSGASLAIEISGENARSIEITLEKLDIRRLEKANLKVLNEGTLTVGLDTEISEELSMEGDVRDLVRGVQNLRKESGLEVVDRITLYLSGSDRLKSAYESFADYIASETLATKILWEKREAMTEIEAGEEKWQVYIERI
ncbi:MAG: isoleucine--tRNA ligase [Treponema sp.]|nr:isoleucine--tRNA ligase [Treponema sp.]